MNRWSAAGFVPPSFPGHALHEKGLQGGNSDGLLVSSQEQGALLVPLTNRRSTAYELVTNKLSTRDFVAAFGLHGRSLVPASWGRFMRCFVVAFGCSRSPCLLGEKFCSTHSCPTPPCHPASPPCAPTRCARGMYVLFPDMPCMKKVYRNK